MRSIARDDAKGMSLGEAHWGLRVLIRRIAYDLRGMDRRDNMKQPGPSGQQAAQRFVGPEHFAGP